jgi:hypothetical protein
MGKWLLDGGGYTFVPQTGYRNYPYGGFLLKYTFGERLELGGELFSHGSEGYTTPQIRGSTLVDIGGYTSSITPTINFSSATATASPD